MPSYCALPTPKSVHRREMTPIYIQEGGKEFLYAVAAPAGVAGIAGAARGALRCHQASQSASSSRMRCTRSVSTG